jgi:glycine/D-amino acid oxidase-like deaminating enzyme
MAQTPDTDLHETPAFPANAATQEAAITFNTLMLLGTFGTAEQAGALLRLKDGRVVRVHPGDVIGLETVMGIETGTVVLARGGDSRVLRMP